MNLNPTWSVILLGAAMAMSQPTAGAADTAPAASAPAPAATAAKGVLGFSLTNPDGTAYPLAQHKGKVILLVNTASRCGFTPQYEGLEALYKTYADKGLVVIGQPANQFAGQEPGTNAEILAFCTGKYNVTFPIVGKAVVKGEGIIPLYKYLTVDGPKPGDIPWNFTKFLIGRNGEVIERFTPNVAPQSPELVKAVEAALAAAP